MQICRQFLWPLLFSLIFWSISGFAASSGSIEIQKIDSELQELEEMKRGYEGRALKHENMAEYLQFDQQAVLETRRHIQLADENRAKAAMVQREIDRLKGKKQQIQKTIKS